MSELNEIEDINLENDKMLLDKFLESVDYYYLIINKSIDLFLNQEIVQSFFSSGSFGEKKSQRINDIMSELKKYNDNLSESDLSLINRTRQYFEMEEID